MCDIGGIHYSVGEYVNLWDYIDQEEVQASKSGKSYRLVFFYTERGASGSTCWMQYTLPNITNVPVDVENPSWDKEALRVEKHVEGDVSHLPASALRVLHHPQRREGPVFGTDFRRGRSAGGK